MRPYKFDSSLLGSPPQNEKIVTSLESQRNRLRSSTLATAYVSGIIGMDGIEAIKLGADIGELC
jgi:hypothetical protein